MPCSNSKVEAIVSNSKAVHEPASPKSGRVSLSKGEWSNVEVSPQRSRALFKQPPIMREAAEFNPTTHPEQPCLISIERQVSGNPSSSCIIQAVGGTT